jgi:hypothetical protein
MYRGWQKKDLSEDDEFFNEEERKPGLLVKHIKLLSSAI